MTRVTRRVGMRGFELLVRWLPALVLGSGGIVLAVPPLSAEDAPGWGFDGGDAPLRPAADELEVLSGAFDRPWQGGGVQAPVTIVVFGDFECPYCARANATLESVLMRYGEQV